MTADADMTDTTTTLAEQLTATVTSAPALTFAELRLANMLHSRKPPTDVPQSELARILTVAGKQSLAQTLADVVIEVDRLAASQNVDLAAAIRARFDPAQKVLHDVTPESPTGAGEDRPFLTDTDGSAQP